MHQAQFIPGVTSLTEFCGGLIGPDSGLTSLNLIPLASVELALIHNGGNSDLNCALIFMLLREALLYVGVVCLFSLCKVL